MSRLPSLLLAGALLLGPPALAADRLERARAAAAQARSQLAALKEQQAQLKGELDTLAGRIGSLKAHSKGSLLPGGELDATLKRSQELSGTLTGLAATLERAGAEAGRANAALAATLSEELARLRARWDEGSREEKARLLGQMRRLRAERESLRATLPPAQLPALLPAPGSDDPEELLEQADALRDAEDKVRRRLAALEARLTEAREERELDRRMGELASEGAVFDEQDRRLRLDRDPRVRDFGSEPVSRPASDMELNSGDSKGGFSGTGLAASRPPTPIPGERASGEGEDLRSLEAQREQLRQLAGELGQKASQLEERARALQ